jgi:hypothetical protein
VYIISNIKYLQALLAMVRVRRERGLGSLLRLYASLVAADVSCETFLSMRVKPLSLSYTHTCTHTHAHRHTQHAGELAHAHMQTHARTHTGGV